MAARRCARGAQLALPFWQVTFWTTRRADAFDQHCSGR
jgi:hypothetical protein